MLDEASFGRVFLAIGVTDLRKSIDGLAVLVSERFKLDPFSACLFVFCNRNRDKIKILHWSCSGFWLHLFRLESGTFQWPMQGEAVKAVTKRELRWLLDGLSLHQKSAHKEVTARIII